MIPAALFLLIELHTPDGYQIEVNPHSIISMHGRRDGSHYTKDAHCLLNMADGKALAVRETCEEVFRLMEKIEESKP